MRLPLDAVVCGLGASLRGWTAPPGAVVFGVNDVGKYLLPDHLVVVDRRLRFAPERLHVIESTKAKVGWLASPDGWSLATHETKHFAITDAHPHRPLDIDGEQLPQYMTSTFAATVIACRLGHLRIGLIGVDLVGHALAKYAASISTMFGRLAHLIEKRGGALVNLSSVSLLTSLPRVSSDAPFMEPACSSVKPS